MTLDEFEDALDQFGPDLDDWPAHQAAAALELLDQSAAAVEALSMAVRLDRELAGMLGTPVTAPSGLADRIVARAASPGLGADVLQFPLRVAAPHVAMDKVPQQRSGYPDRPVMIAAAMLVACFIGGLITVQTVPPMTVDHQSVYISAIYSDLAR